MRSGEELKQIFQEGWNIPARIDNYVRNVADGEFADGECRSAWHDTLSAILATKDRLRILDVGTGPGNFAGLYSQMGHQCVGLDFSEAMLSVARQRAADMHPDCSFVFGDAENPPFAQDTFDVVSSRHLLFNLPHPGVAVREWVRVLKAGGRLILIGEDHNQNNDRPSVGRVGRMLTACVARWKRGRAAEWKPSREYLKAVFECPLFRHTPGSVCAMMEAAGLNDVRSISTLDISSARIRNRAGIPCGGPYILVGTKPCDLATNPQ
jgi:ubiquinone/menaquinone biosynthesis C-methylase UbiE